MTNVFVYVILVHVHISNLAAQTGASLFLQVHSPPYLSSLSPQTNTDIKVNHNWVYNKTENLSPVEITSPKSGFTHAIVEVEDEPTQQLKVFLTNSSWRKVECISAFDRFRVRRGKVVEGSTNIWDWIPRLEFVYTEKLCIFERI